MDLTEVWLELNRNLLIFTIFEKKYFCRKRLIDLFQIGYLFDLRARQEVGERMS